MNEIVWVYFQFAWGLERRSHVRFQKDKKKSSEVMFIHVESND